MIAWAVLVDSSVRASNKYVLSSGVVQSRELVLIQHGVLGIFLHPELRS